MNKENQLILGKITEGKVKAFKVPKSKCIPTANKLREKNNPEFDKAIKHLEEFGNN